MNSKKDYKRFQINISKHKNFTKNNKKFHREIPVRNETFSLPYY